MMNRAFPLIVAALAIVACGEKKAPQSLPEAPAQETAAAASFDASAAMEKGVLWLRAQARDGVWFGSDGRGNSYPSVAHTSLSLAAVATALPREKRSSDPLVKKASAFIVKNVGEDGGVHLPGMPKYDNYFTSTALMALAIVDDPATKPQREKMRDFILTLQRKEKGRIEGGFGYNTAGNADLSNSQYAIEALRAAGLPENHPRLQEALRYLERVQNRSENEENKEAVYEMEDEAKGKIKVVPGNDGSASYEPGVSKAGMTRLPDGTYVPRGYGSMTYALLKCYILVGLEADDPRVQAVIDWVSKNYTWDENPGFRETAKELNKPDAPYWGLFYYYMTAAKALHVAGVATLDTADGKRDWRDDLSAAIARRQRDDGSWINEKASRWEESDPIFATGFALISLQEAAAAR